MVSLKEELFQMFYLTRIFFFFFSSRISAFWKSIMKFFQVFYRNGVTRNTPEGDSWIEVPTGDLNLVQISVGPLGLLWGCTWDGKAVVRSGVTYIKPYGMYLKLFG